MAILRVMVGLPGAGKSTVVAKMKGFEVVCPDDIRTKMNDGKFKFNRADEPRVWRRTISAVESALKSGKNVVVDATNVEPAARLRWVKMKLSGLATKLEAVVVLASTAACLARIKFRGGGKSSVIKKMYRYLDAWSPPTTEEGFDSVRIVRDRRRSKRRPRRRASIRIG
jgi:predicted kinase